MKRSHAIPAGARIGVISLGCPRNVVDTESILGELNAAGHPIVDIEEADVAIVNTCAFVEDAKKESIDVILELINLKKEGRLKGIFVYGCLAQRYKDELRKELPEVDQFVGVLPLGAGTKRFAITPRHFAYLKICEGCVNACSFCSIPRIKGSIVSLERDALLEKVEALNKAGIAELNIIGQDITGYGMDLHGRPVLAEELKSLIARAPAIGWFRLLYLHPARITDELLRLINDEPRLCKYVDVPVQHVSDRVLKLMNRGTAKDQLLRLIERIRSLVPGAALRTAVITGFPTETEDEFEELLAFIREVKFERLGAFIYSREEGTPAFDLQPQIPQQVKEERFDRIMSLQRDISAGINAGLMGTTMRVLIDEPGDKGVFLGRSQADAPEVDGTVYVHSDRELKAGDFVKVRISDTLEYDLVGVEET